MEMVRVTLGGKPLEISLSKYQSNTGVLLLYEYFLMPFQFLSLSTHPILYARCLPVSFFVPFYIPNDLSFGLYDLSFHEMLFSCLSIALLVSSIKEKQNDPCAMFLILIKHSISFPSWVWKKNFFKKKSSFTITFGSRATFQHSLQCVYFLCVEHLYVLCE